MLQTRIAYFALQAMSDGGSDVACDVQNNFRELVCSTIKESADSQATWSSSKNVEPVLLCR